MCWPRSRRNGSQLKAIAPNDYKGQHPGLSATQRFDMVLALRVDGERISVRNKGPSVSWSALDDRYLELRSIRPTQPSRSGSLRGSRLEDTARRPSQRSFLLGLSLTAALLAGGLHVIMLAVLMRQARTVEEATGLCGRPRPPALAFQLEQREFCACAPELTLTLHGHQPPDWEAVVLRYGVNTGGSNCCATASTIKLRATGIPGADAADRAVDHQATPLFSNAELHADALEALPTARQAWARHAGAIGRPAWWSQAWIEENVRW